MSGEAVVESTVPRKVASASSKVDKQVARLGKVVVVGHAGSVEVPIFPSGWEEEEEEGPVARWEEEAKLAG